MRTPTHAAFGLLLTTTTLSFWSLPLHLDPPALGATLLGSLLPDLDTPKSLIGRLLPVVSRPLEARYTHRGAPHSLLALALLAAVASPLWLYRGTCYAGLLLGCTSHLLADSFTKSGTPLAHPARYSCMLPGQERFRVRTGSGGEVLFLVLVVALLVPAVSLSRSGGVWHALRHWAATPAMAYREYRDATTETVLEFQGQWQDSRLPVAGEALILQANPLSFLISFQGQVWRYGEQDGDILPQRSRTRITGRPVRVDTLRARGLQYALLLARIPDGALVSGELETTVPFVPGMRGELPRSRHQSVRLGDQTMALAFAPRALLARLHPARRVDSQYLAQVQAQARQARAELGLLQLQRPPAHVLRLQEALDRLQEQERELARLQDSTVTFTGVLYLRRPGGEATP